MPRKIEPQTTDEEKINMLRKALFDEIKFMVSHGYCPSEATQITLEKTKPVLEQKIKRKRAKELADKLLLMCGSSYQEFENEWDNEEDVLLLIESYLSL